MKQDERKNIWELKGELLICDVLDLESGIVFRLYRAGFVTLGQLSSLTEQDLKRIPKGGTQSFGAITIEKIQVALVKAGFPKLPQY